MPVGSEEKVRTPKYEVGILTNQLQYLIILMSQKQKVNEKLIQLNVFL
jgi:hypothetical protein